MAIDLTKALSVLRAQLGYREGPRNNEQKYSPNVPGLEWSQFQPWCATMTCWVFLQAGGTPGTDFPLTASCLQQVAWGRSRGRFYSTPRVGDLIMLGPGGGTHVEIVTRVSGGTVWSIGGNTSGSWNGDWANGDGVYEKSRSISSAYGFVRPFYGPSGGNAGEDDTMPDIQEFTASAGQTADSGTWTTVAFDKRDGKSGDFHSVALEGRRVSLTAFVTLDGTDFPAGAEGQIRAALYRQTGGIDLPSGILRKGAKGAAVRQLQDGLKSLGADLGRWGADGDYGDDTVTAVKWVQRRGGLTGAAVDGVYGPTTKGVMERLAPAPRWTLARSLPLAGDVHGGGDLHLDYAVNVDVPSGQRLRLRVVGYGGKPVRVKAARATVFSWKR
ncbi:peptidoglycan-binding protein [Nocardiopsis alba]|uniref:C40 family peptidase n=1 Tax=Nocardiopsis alba TaxID=53437 RepID=UPI003D71CB59